MKLPSEEPKSTQNAAPEPTAPVPPRPAPASPPTREPPPPRSTAELPAESSETTEQQTTTEAHPAPETDRAEPTHEPTLPEVPATPAAHLRQLVAGLLFLSETDAPFTVVELPKEAVLPDALRTLAPFLPADAPAEEWELADVLTPATLAAAAGANASADAADAADAAPQEDAARHTALLTLLTAHLKRPVAYKLGADAKKALFFIGRTPDRSWLGLQTEAVET